MDWGEIVAKLGRSRGNALPRGKADRMSPTTLAPLFPSLRLAYMPGLAMILGLLRGRRAISAAA